MGLFGGFKAKFTKDSKGKDKSQNNVVVLKYHSFSEFDTPYQSGPPTNNIKDNGVIHNNPRGKQRPIVNSAIFEDSTNEILNNIKKSLSLNNIVAESNRTPSASTSRKEREFKSSVETPKNRTEATKNSTKPTKNSSESTKNSTKPAKNSSQTTKNSTEWTKNNTESPENAESPSSSYQVVLPNTPSSQNFEEHKNEEETKLKKSRRKAPNAPTITEDSQTSSGHNLQQNTTTATLSSPDDGQYYKDEGELQEQSTLIFMTQQKPVTESDAAISWTQEHTADGYNSNNDEFKVNVVQHDSNRTRSFSEDEISVAEEELTSIAAMGYSSQAASIFFGDDMLQPVITRPRRFIVMDDSEQEGDKNDDHRETDNEADC